MDDFNADVIDPNFQFLQNFADDAKMVRLPWNFATHHRGRCIDHIFMAEEMTRANTPIVVAAPTE